MAKVKRGIAEHVKEAAARAARRREIARDREAWSDEVATMVKLVAETIEDKEGRQAFIAREWRAAWDVFRRRHSIRGSEAQYQHAVWRDAVARRMGWLTGRIGNDECRLQRQLEAMGQMRIEGA